MDMLAFAFSAAVALILTNLDNLAVLLALILSIGKTQSVVGYILSQAVVMAASLIAAMGLAQLMSGQIGYLGIVPIGLGVWTLFFQKTEAQNAATPAKSGVMAVSVIFICMSFDSFAVMTPLLADSLPSYRFAAVIGAAGAVAVLVGLALLMAQPMRRWAPRLEKLGAVAMILAGIYVLMNTGTDIT